MLCSSEMNDVMQLLQGKDFFPNLWKSQLCKVWHHLSGMKVEVLSLIWNTLWLMHTIHSPLALDHTNAHTHAHAHTHTHTRPTSPTAHTYAQTLGSRLNDRWRGLIAIALHHQWQQEVMNVIWKEGKGTCWLSEAISHLSFAPCFYSCHSSLSCNTPPHVFVSWSRSDFLWKNMLVYRLDCGVKWVWTQNPALATTKQTLHVNPLHTYCTWGVDILSRAHIDGLTLRTSPPSETVTVNMPWHLKPVNVVTLFKGSHLQAERKTLCSCDVSLKYNLSISCTGVLTV